MKPDKTIIFDLDGTLCDITHRLHFIKCDKPDWPAFHVACVDDTPKENIIALYNCLWCRHNVLIVSGRSDAVRHETEQWLSDNLTLPDKLIMRVNGDHTPDTELKRGWLKDGTLPPKEDILCVFEDRQRLVDMWREEGLTCLQVEAWEEWK